MKILLSAILFTALCCATGQAFAQSTDVLLFPEDALLDGSGMKLDYNVRLIDWTNKQEVATWEFNTPTADDYHVYFEFAAPGWSKGSQIEVLIDDQVVSPPFTIQATRGDRRWDFRIYKLTKQPAALTAGPHVLKLRPIKGPEKRLVAAIRMGLVTPNASARQIVDASFYQKKATFLDTLMDLYEHHPELAHHQLLRPVWDKLWNDFPQQMNWFSQDMADPEESKTSYSYEEQRVFDNLQAVAPYFEHNRAMEQERKLIQRVLEELDEDDKATVTTRLANLDSKETNRKSYMMVYLDACKKRRAKRLRPLLARTDQIIFAKHQVFGSRSAIYNITETEGMQRGEKSVLCSIDLRPERYRQFATESVLFDAKGGIVRDPELSHDAEHLLFAWRKSTRNINTVNSSAPKDGNYQIYEMELATGDLRQLTTDETYGANYEPCYMPNGDIMFNSARIVQHITCGWGDHSNLFLMDKDGKYQRRVGFDQVSSQFPTLLNNGQVIHLRRDYNDRGQTAAHALIAMNPDGTGQTEYYGNQTMTPNSFMHARAIPGSDKIMCVLSGYHTRQGGLLAIVDVRKGRNHGEGVTVLPQNMAPYTRDAGDDGYGKIGPQYANPFPISETELVVSHSPTWCPNKSGGGTGELYGIYFMTTDGRSELLARDPANSCLQPVLVQKRENLPTRPSLVDYTKDSGIFYVQNVYLGAASKGIKPGTVKKIRIIELLYKHDTIGSGAAAGPGGSWDTVTSPAHPLALFDAKKIIGTATVYEDGSAMFEAPSRSPLYFQLLDEKNRAVQTMRSWTTLMPNERFSCVGCHEDKNDTPVVNARTIAMTKGIEQIAPFYGPARGFSYLAEIQPIFDKHCVSCHQKDGKAEKLQLTAEPFTPIKRDRRKWAHSYVQLMAARPGPDPSVYQVSSGPESWIRRGPAKEDEPNKYVQYWTRLGPMTPIQPYYAGAITSGIIKKLEKGHANVKLSNEEWDKLVTWIDLNAPYCGDYMESNNWSDKEIKRYKGRIAERQRNEALEAEAIKNYIQDGQP